MEDDFVKIYWKYFENILKQIFQLELNDKTNLTKKKMHQ